MKFTGEGIVNHNIGATSVWCYGLGAMVLLVHGSYSDEMCRVVLKN